MTISKDIKIFIHKEWTEPNRWEIFVDKNDKSVEIHCHPSLEYNAVKLIDEEIKKK